MCGLSSFTTVQSFSKIRSHEVHQARLTLFSIDIITTMGGNVA